MSLLIKALDKAEKSQAERNSQSNDAALALSPVDGEGVSQAAQKSTQNGLMSEHTNPLSQQTRASNLFTAKSVVDSSNRNLWWLALAGLLLLSAMGAYFYLQLTRLSDTTPITPSPIAQVAPQPQVALPRTQETDPSVNVVPMENPSPKPMPTEQSGETPVALEKPLQSEGTQAFRAADSQSVADDSLVETGGETEQNKRKIRKQRTQAMVDMGSTPSVASKSVSISVSKNRQPTTVNSTLVSAYQAYQAGDDAQAQELYRKVLQRDPYSVDALLGMAAIAQKQGRDADATGWYQKVIEVEPKNTIARVALSNASIQEGQTNTESHLKNMLTQNPEDANLHASLGNYYADQNLWSSAQQAYFDAYRLNQNNADYAFNLAISLDQMQKPQVALPYYQRALELVRAGAKASLNQSELEARIGAIQNNIN